MRDCAYAPNSRPGRTNIQKIGSPNISQSLEWVVPKARVAQGLASDTPQPVDQRPNIDPSVAAAHHFDTDESRPRAQGVGRQPGRLLRANELAPLTRSPRLRGRAA